MEAVIVTCLKDRLQFLILCRTMGRYLEPCKIAIIINERDDDFRFLKTWIEHVCLKYISLHDVTLISEEEIHPDIHKLQVNGWISQQLLKLFYFKKTKSDYCVLDSKNWFIKHCTIDMISNNRPIKLPKSIIPSMITYAISRLKYVYRIRGKNESHLKDIIKEFIPIETPYLIKKSVVKSMIKFFVNEKNFMRLFKNDQYHSEFMLHYFFEEINRDKDYVYEPNRIHRTIWRLDTDQYNLSYLDLWYKFQECEDFLVLGIHKSALKKMPLKDFKKVLNTLDFTLDDEIQEVLYCDTPYKNVPTLN